jgi:hypothetical protein
MGNLLLSSYLLFLVLMLGFSIYTNGEIIKQGRYFLPFIMASNLCATIYAPQVLPHRFGRALSILMLTALCVYSAVASVFAIRSLERRFYVSPAHAFPFERSLHVDSSCFDPGVDIDRATLVTVRKQQPLILCGWVFDTSTGDPVQSVLAQIDAARPSQVTYGLPRPDVVESLLDERLLPSGFRAVIRTNSLSPGIHRLRFLVEEPRRGRVYAVMYLRLDVFD